MVLGLVGEKSDCSTTSESESSLCSEFQMEIQLLHRIRLNSGHKSSVSKIFKIYLSQIKQFTRVTCAVKKVALKLALKVNFNMLGFRQRIGGYCMNEGIYCMVCKKHNMKHPNNQRETFSGTPSVRFKVDALNKHSKFKPNYTVQQ